MKRDTERESLRYINKYIPRERERDGGRLQWTDECESKSKTLRESPLIVVTAGWALLFG